MVNEQAGRFVPNPGWPMSILAALMLTVTTVTIILTVNSSTFYVTQAAAVGFAIALIGLVIGSETLTGLATAPALGSVLIGVGEGSGLGWGRALIVGCLWYVTMELAWSAMRQRAGPEWDAAIITQRTREVASVVVISLAVGLSAIGLTSVAPTRTLLVRAMIAAALLVTLVVAIRQLSATAPPTEESPT